MSSSLIRKMLLAASRPIINVCTAAVAAKLLQSVSSIVGKAVTAPTGAARTAEDVLEDLDQDIYLAFGFEVPRRLYSPLRQFSPQIDTSGTSPEGNSLKHWIMELLNSLTITLGDLLDEDESARAELEVAMKLKSSYTDRDWLQIPIKFTIPQFVALLDAFGKTPEIQSVVKLHCINAFAPDMQVDLIDKPIPVDCLRNGYVQLKAPFSEGNYTLLMNDRVRQLVQPSLHPIVVFVSQSIEALRRVSELEVQKEDSTKQVSGRDLFIKQLEESLDVVFESLAVLEKAQEASSSGSVETALDLVTSTLKKILLFEEDAEEDSELAEEREFHTIIHWQPCSSLLETEIENKDVVSTSEKFILQLRSREVTIVPVFLQTKLMLSR